MVHSNSWLGLISGITLHVLFREVTSTEGGGYIWERSVRPGLEKLLDELAVLGAPQAAERYLLESSVAAVGVQKRLLRQRLVCCVAQAQADVLLSRLHYCLPGWGVAEQRRRRAERGEWQEAARARGRHCS